MVLSEVAGDEDDDDGWICDGDVCCCWEVVGLVANVVLKVDEEEFSVLRVVFDCWGLVVSWFMTVVDCTGGLALVDCVDWDGDCDCGAVETVAVVIWTGLTVVCCCCCGVDGGKVEVIVCIGATDVVDGKRRVVKKLGLLAPSIILYYTDRTFLKRNNRYLND